MTGTEWIESLRTRGARVRLLADGGVYVKPARVLTAADRAALSEIRDEVIRALLLEPTPCPWGCGQVVAGGAPMARHVNRECPAALAAAEAAKPRPEACAQCGQVEPVMVGMEPGDDGKPWALCAPCHRGAR